MDEVTRYHLNSAATYRIDVTTPRGGGHGSGTVISADGYILTVNHVVDTPGSRMSITLSENGGPPQTLPAVVICRDVINDLAVIKVDRRFLDPTPLEDMRNVRPGAEVYNIGYPFDFGEMVARGHILRLHFYEPEADMDQVPWEDRIYVRDMVLADFLAGPGTSGSGVYLASSGKLVGVMRLLLGRGNIRSGMIVRAFVPVDRIESFLEMNRIPFVRPDGTVATYPALPSPTIAPPPLKPRPKPAPKPKPVQPAPAKPPPHR